LRAAVFVMEVAVDCGNGMTWSWLITPASADRREREAAMTSAKIFIAVRASKIVNERLAEPPPAGTSSHAKLHGRRSIEERAA